MHEDQLHIDEPIVRRLVAEQFPEWAEHPIRQFDSPGTVNAIFRIGDELAARFPLKSTTIDSVRADMDAARTLHNHVSVPTPEPVALGESSSAYPNPWMVQTWIPGLTASDAGPTASLGLAADLANFIAQVRLIPTQGRSFSGTGRGGNLANHDRWMNHCFDKSTSLLDVGPLREMWHKMVDLPHPSLDVMSHTDLGPTNILVDRARLTGVIDTDGLSPADPALDIIAAWNLFDLEARAEFRRLLSCSDLEWDRSRAWAFEQAMGLIWYYQHTNPFMSDYGRQTLERIAADPP